MSPNLRVGAHGVFRIRDSEGLAFEDRFQSDKVLLHRRAVAPEVRVAHRELPDGKHDFNAVGCVNTRKGLLTTVPSGRRASWTTALKCLQRMVAFRCGLAAGHVDELRVMQLVRDRHGIDGAAAVLSQDDVGLAGTLVIAILGVRAVEQHNHIGVLLQRT